MRNSPEQQRYHPYDALSFVEAQARPESQPRVSQPQLTTPPSGDMQIPYPPGAWVLSPPRWWGRPEGLGIAAPPPAL